MSNFSHNFGIALGLARAIRESRTALDEQLDKVKSHLNGARAHALSSGAEADAYKALAAAMIAEAGRPEASRRFSTVSGDDARAKLFKDVYRRSWESRLSKMQWRHGGVPVTQSTVNRGKELNEKTIANYPLAVQKMRKATSTYPSSAF